MMIIKRIVHQCALSLLVLLVITLMVPAWAAFEVPPYQGYVNDLANILSPTTEYQITQIATELDQKAHTQFAVLTVDSLEGTAIEMASLQVARGWGVGYGDDNSGLLIMVAVQERKMRTEIGYGLEGTIPDGLSGEIQDKYMLPYFRKKNYNYGVLNGVIAYALEVAEEKDIELTSLKGDSVIEDIVQQQEQTATVEGDGSIAGSLLIFIIILMLVVMQIFGILPFFFLPIGYPRRGRGGTFGGFSGGSFGGGFGGFGGGGFGGGGSTRSW